MVYLRHLHHHSSWVGRFSGFINGLIAAAIGAVSMLMSEPTAKSNVKRKCMFVLSIATLHCIALHYIPFHSITLHCIALHCITLHYITLHYITLHYITLHYITLHYITLHYITLKEQGAREQWIEQQRSKAKGLKCHYWGKFGHIRRNCKEWVRTNLEARRKPETLQASQVTRKQAEGK